DYYCQVWDSRTYQWVF
nr:immunoglobulin light chain junction region [Macaca mulatta]MOW36154.1 immunoglobulin light chain junction region [Macaca mulatta]MOW36279.1 immunoglobulin light chain junction region [Macaca mulatta]MOW36639.1 immunoglobulin light chain junction region [Macaca mulatta]MOW36681.1 immunoglobulin light chain junction region [Macaca mulatta]